MSRNIGLADALIRIAIGLIILGVGLYFKSWWGLLPHPRRPRPLAVDESGCGMSPS